jgi:hypothetical protein
MFFKLNAKNAYRDLVRNARRVITSDVSDEQKLKSLLQLYSLLKNRLYENEQALTSNPAFAKRCEHWNQLDIASIRPVTTLRNPWLLFKREFEQALSVEPTTAVTAISVALAWFYNNQYRDDWLVE